MQRRGYSRVAQGDAQAETERKGYDAERVKQQVEATFAARVQVTVVLGLGCIYLGHTIITGKLWWHVMIPGAIFLALHGAALWMLGANRSSQIWLALMLVPAFVITPLCLAMPSEEFITVHEEAKDGTATLAMFFCVGMGHAINLRSITWKVLGGASFVGSRLAGELLLERAHSYQSFTRFYVLHGHLPFVAGAIFGQLITYTLVEVMSPLHASLCEAERRNGELEQARQASLIREFQRSMAREECSAPVAELSSSRSAPSVNGSDHGSHHTSKVGNVVFEPVTSSSIGYVRPTGRAA